MSDELIGVEISKLGPIQENEVVFVKFDINYWDVDTAHQFYKNFAEMLPGGTRICGMFTGMEVEARDIKELISDLEALL